VKTGEADHFNLPPSRVAKPLPAYKSSGGDGRKSHARGSNKMERGKRSGTVKDDTPKAFLRLMQFSKTGKGPNGLDDGILKSVNKKRKHAQNGEQAAISELVQDAPIPVPTILPGERLGDFAARVDQSMPIIGLARKGKVGGERQTKHEKKLQKMVNTWKEEEARRLEKVSEAYDIAEQEEDEEQALLEAKMGTMPKSGMEGGRKGKKKNNQDDDPWAELEAKRERPKGIHDIVQEPPSFTSMPKETFKVRDGAKVIVADVPNKAGSLKRREELGEARKDVITRYREMMAQQRADERTG